MSKDSKKNLVGQPIFKQIIKMLPREQFDILVHQLGSDRLQDIFFVGTVDCNAVRNILKM